MLSDITDYPTFQRRIAREAKIRILHLEIEARYEFARYWYAIRGSGAWLKVFPWLALVFVFYTAAIGLILCIHLPSFVPFRESIWQILARYAKRASDPLPLKGKDRR